VLDRPIPIVLSVIRRILSTLQRKIMSTERPRGRRRRRKRNDVPPPRPPAAARDGIENDVEVVVVVPPPPAYPPSSDGVIPGDAKRPPNVDDVERGGTVAAGVDRDDEANDDDREMGSAGPAVGAGLDEDKNETRDCTTKNGRRWADVQLSKSLSWVLRHSGPSLGLHVGSDGYASLHDILTLDHPRFKFPGGKGGGPRYSVEDVRRVVNNNDKRRFRLAYKRNDDDEDNGDDDDADIAPSSSSREKTTSTEGMGIRNDQDDGNVDALTPDARGKSPDDERHLLIRANQGHSLRGMNANMLLTPLTTMELSDPNAIIVHGTTRVAWEKHIQHGGLSRMRRNHIHFATGLPRTAPSPSPSNSSSGDGDTNREGGGMGRGEGNAKRRGGDNVVPISGMRSSSEIYIYVNGPKCASDGIAFHRSDNGVILTAGVDGGGMLPPRYFAKVVDAPTGTILWRGGVSAK
jgi:2'-phosphotransferase